MNDLPPSEQGRGAPKRHTARLMKRARTVQLSMLPKMPVIDGLDLHAHYQPCEAIGGDFYDFVSVSPWELGIVMGDVAGHGIDAALIMAVAKKSIQLNGQGRSSPRETLLVTCADLAQDLPGNCFVTVFYGVLDLRNWRLTFASAGHMPPILFNPARSPQLQSIASRGVVMGASFVKAMEQSLAEQTVQFRTGDTLFLYTDGLTEAPNAEGLQFGEPRVMRSLDTAGDGDARKIISTVVDDLERFRGGGAAEDDLTMLALRISDAAKQATRMPERKNRRAWPTNLRLPTSTFIGRSSELSRLQEWLHEEGALATITGSAGLGKSRLALEAGRSLLEHLPGGVWVVDASQIRETERLAEAVAQVLGISTSGDATPEAAVALSLEFRPPLLLILDNSESAEQQVGPMLARWRKAAPRTRVMVTSREPLGISGERLLALTPLTTASKSSDKAAMRANESFALFVERAKEANPELAVDDEALPRIAAICRDVEGNPLAIELAAAQMQTLSPRQINEGLQREFETRRPVSKRSKDSAPIIPPQTLDWTYDLLRVVEKSAFCQLSLMRGGFFLQAAEALLDVSDIEGAPDTVEILQSLCDKRLFQSQDTPYGTRFVPLPPIRSFGRRKRAESFSAGQEDALTRRFVEYFVRYASDLESRYHSRAAIEVLDRLEYDLENIFAAQDFALAMGEAELAARAILGMAPLLNFRGPERERIPRFTRALEAMGQGSSPELRMKLRTALGQACFFASTWDEALAHVNAALSLADPEQYSDALVDALADRSFVLSSRGDLAGARRDIENARKLVRNVPDDMARCRIELYAGWLDYQERKAQAALACYDYAEPLLRAAGNLPLLIECLNSRGIVLRALHRLEESLACAKEAEDMLRQFRSTKALAVQIGNIGVIYRIMERLDEALECFQQAEAGLREVGDRLGLTRTLSHIADLYLFLDEVDLARKIALEGLEYSNRQGDKIGMARLNALLGHAAYAQSDFGEALRRFETTVTIHTDMKHDLEAAGTRAFAMLCLTELDRAAEAEAALNKALEQVKDLPLRDNTLTFLLMASRAKAEFAQGKRSQAKKSLDEAQALGDKTAQSHYTSDRSLQLAWQVIDALRSEGLREPSAPQNVKVRCEHCHGKVRGTQKRLEDLVACPVCNTAPFRYIVIDA